MTKVNFKQIEAFVQVAAVLNFRRAAENLNTTQPNISSRISALETLLGEKLFSRHASMVRLTPFGEALLPKATNVLQSMDDFLGAVNNDQLYEGVMRLGVTEMIVHTWLGKYLGVFQQRFPHVDIELTVDLSSNLSAVLFDRGVDLVLQSGPFQKPTSGMIEIGQFPFVWVAAGEYAKHRALSLATLCEHTVLTHAKGTLPYQQLVRHLTDSAEQSPRIFPSTNIAACLQMALDGLGIACLPEAMVQSEIDRGRLMQLDYTWSPDPLEFFARFETDTAPRYVHSAGRLAAEIASDWAQ